MITTLEEFYRERYQALELELLNRVSKRIGEDFQRISKACVEHWQRILKEALKVQEREHIPCAYMSVSLLNTSLLEKKPILQVDFYNGEWVYGEPWARGCMPGDFLFLEWESFCAEALDDSFYVRNSLNGTAIRSLFWGTSEKLMYIFACFAKYFARELDELPEFKALEKEQAMYVTCGTYLDWQERVHAVLPRLELGEVPDEGETRFRDYHGESYKKKTFLGLDLRHCRFYDCVFKNCVFEQTNISDGYFSNCRFKDTEFKEVKLAGCIWENCGFESCGFMDSGTGEDGNEYFADAEMTRVKFSDTKIVGCDFSNFRLRDCQKMDVKLENVSTVNSDWGSYVEVKADG